MPQIEGKVTFDKDGMPAPRVLAVGMQGDNHARLIRFAAPEITEAQRVYVVVQSGTNQDKIRLYQDEEGLWGWTISRSAMAVFGNGHAQVQVTDQTDPLNIKWQSGRIEMSIGASMDVDADLSQKGITLIEQMQADMIASEAVVEGYAKAAAGSAAAAADSASEAAGSASAAAGSAAAAADDAQKAADSATQAADSAVQAAGSKTAAAGSAGRAEASADSAAASAEDARKSADEAAQIVTGDLDTRYVRLTDYTAAAVLGKVKAVDGSGSGLDADLLDGKQGSEYAAKQHTHAQGDVTGLSGSLSGLTSRVDGLAGSKADKPQTYTAVLTAAGWAGSKAPYMQTVSIAGVPAEGVVIVGLAAGATEQQIEVCRSARIEPTQQAAGAITVAAQGVKPGVDLPISATVVK